MSPMIDLAARAALRAGGRHARWLALAAMVALAGCGVSEAPAPAEPPDASAPVGAPPLPEADAQALQRVVSCNAPEGEVFVAPTPPQQARCGAYAPFRQAFFGDTHVHTEWSFDAFAQATGRGPDWAVRFAKGETPPGAPMTLKRPLDFVMIADHSELIGEVQICTDPEVDPQGFRSPECQAFRDELPIPVESPLPFAFGELLFALGLGQPFADRLPFCLQADCEEVAAQFWDELIRINDSHYQACDFTTLHGYEWTYSPNAAQAHRNIMFRDTASARSLRRPISYFDAESASDLARDLRTACPPDADCHFLSMPHNANISRGRQFFIDPLRLQDPVYIDDLGEIARVNKAFEVVQEKGSSECRLGLGSTDENCDFELINRHRPLCCNPARDITDNCVSALEAPNCTPVCPLGRPSDAVIETDIDTGCQAPQDFVRNAYKDALEAQSALGFNPLKLGLIGSTDSHRALSGGVDERFGRTRTDRVGPGAQGNDRSKNFGGLAGVWAEENTRESIYAAFSRREVFATSGPRIKLRMWAGDFPEAMCERPPRDFKRLAYRHGVPMGQDLAAEQLGGQAPELLIQAQMDERPLERLQVVKVWVDASGAQREQVFTLDAADGPGATVDAQCRTQVSDPRDDIRQFCAQWRDPDFDPSLDAAYYARVLEAERCRWTAHACRALRGAPGFCDDNPDSDCCPGGRFAEDERIQDRAWSSPVWVTPSCGEPVATDFPLDPSLPSPVGR